jgi:hypothetical protein
VELDGFSLLQGQSFEIIDVGGAASGAFTGLAEGASLGNFGGTNLYITYGGGDGNDVMLFVPGLPGDFNANGSVDAADYIAWRKIEGAMNALPNVGGLPGPIGAAHYNLWRTNFGLSSGSGASTYAPVPEPAALVIVLIGAATILTLRYAR